jgi:hypothetical protein
LVCLFRTAMAQRGYLRSGRMASTDETKRPIKRRMSAPGVQCRQKSYNFSFSRTICRGTSAYAIAVSATP